MSVPNSIKIGIVRVPTMIDATASTAPVCPPLGLAYLKGVLNSFTSDISIVDSVGNYTKMRSLTVAGKDYRLLGQTAEEIVELVPSDRDMILLSIMFSQDWPYTLRVLSQLKKKCPQAVFVAGGEHITAVPEFSLSASPELDVCVLGEGEPVLQEILERYKPGKLFPQDIPGTCIRDQNNGFIRNPRRARVTNLKELARPDWDGFPLENYLCEGHGFGVNLGRSMPIMATRGCPYQCTFCSNPLMWTTTWKAREPDDVLDEIKLYMRKYQAQNFDFYDLTAIIKKEWIVKFAQALIKENLNITWQLPSGTRSEAIDREVAKLLYTSGCRNLSYAPESGSEEVLKMIKKKIQIPRMIESMKDCIAEGLSIKANIICGFPEEKPKHLIETLGFLTKIAWIGVDDMSINQFSPYPGSELFEDLIKANKVRLDAEYFESLSYYSSMTNARSYSNHLTSRQILIYKFVGTLLFYALSFLRRPWRLVRTIRNAYAGIETTRMEKTLNSYFHRVRVFFGKSQSSIGKPAKALN